MIKLLTFAILVSVVWMVPNYKRYESINKLYENASSYQTATFKVTGHKESKKVFTTKTDINDSYLIGDVFVGSENKKFTNEYFSNNKVYYQGELKKAFPTGTKIKVKFNYLEKNWENGQTMRVQKFGENLTSAQVKTKRDRFQRITFGPLAISLACSFIFLIFCLIRRKLR